MLTVEQCTKLKASSIPYRGMARLVLGGRGFGINATPQAVSIVSGRLAQRIGRIKLPYGGRAHGGFTLWFLCPTCGRKTPTLYLPPGGKGFACRYCLRLTYAQWRRNGYNRWPKSAGLWLVHFARRAARVLERSGSRVARPGGRSAAGDA